MAHWATAYAAQLAEHSEDGIIVLDGSRRIQQANARAAELAGARETGDLLGLQFGWESDAASVRLDCPFAVTDGNGSVPGTLSSEFGAELPVEVKSFPVEAGGLLLLIADRSRRIELERAAIQAEKMAAMDNIIAGIAHELNNPMTAILGYSELLLATETDPKRKQRASLIAEEADRCGKIITSMLTFTRSYGNTLERGNVNAILEEVIELQSYQLRVDGIRIHSFYDQEIPDFPLVPAGLRRLFLNLVHNAHQALRASASEIRNLWVLTESRTESVLVQIADDGPGVPQEIRDRIFDPFFTTRSLGEGMGLGLSVAYGIVREHGGRLWFEPRVGGGSAFYVELPIRMESP